MDEEGGGGWLLIFHLFVENWTISLRGHTESAETSCGWLVMNLYANYIPLGGGWCGVVHMTLR